MMNKDIVKVDSKNVNKCVPVENYKGVLQFICADIERSFKLTMYLKEQLKKMFGKHNTRFKGEFFYYVWIVEFDGEIFQIFTTKGKGTTFNIVAKREEEKSKVCISFLKKMEELIDGVEKFDYII